MSELTETQRRNVEILRSQGDSDERIAANLRIPVEDVPTVDTDPDHADTTPDPAPPAAPVTPPVAPPVAPATKR